MHTLIRDVQKAQLKKVPEIRTGYTIRVHQKIKEGNKERVQIFEGLVIKVSHGEGVEKTITVRKIVQGIGVEKVFPIHSPNITKIDVRKKAKIRRSKLYYMRKRSGKSARLQERHVTDQERAEEDAKMEAMIQEAVKADEKRKAKEEKAAADSELSSGEKVEGETTEPADQPSETTESDPELDSGEEPKDPESSSGDEEGEVAEGESTDESSDVSSEAQAEDETPAKDEEEDTKDKPAE